MRTLLFGAHANELLAEVERYPNVTLAQSEQEHPDVVICYGGDGTLLTAERKWPGVPKAPIRNSHRGHRCLAHPAPEIIERLANNRLYRTEFTKLACQVRSSQGRSTAFPYLAMNEINVHMGRINSAVRFKLWIDEEPFEDGHEILGDGFVVSTPFGSTAYFNQITRGVFHTGIGIAFKFIKAPVNHVIVPESFTVRAVITRGPAVLAHDNAPEYHDLEEGDELIVQRHKEPAVILTWEPMKYPSDQF